MIKLNASILGIIYRDMKNTLMMLIFSSISKSGQKKVKVDHSADSEWKHIFNYILSHA